jgi:hypothetical protein
MGRMLEFFGRSKLGIKGSLIYIWLLVSIGVFDAFQFASGMFDMFLLKQFPTNMINVNTTVGDMFLAFNSIHFGLLFFIFPLVVFYNPIFSVSRRGFKILKSGKIPKISFIWLLWLTKMLFVGTLIEQGTFWTCRTILHLAGLSAFSLSETFYLWVSGPIVVSYPNVHGIIIFDIFVVVVLFVLHHLEKALRKRWKFYD